MYAKEEGVRNAARLYSVNKETVCRWMRLDIEKKPVVISETTDVSADEDIYIFFHVLAHTVKNNEEYTLYQFNVTNESDTFKSIGFTASKYNTNLCVFLDYVLSTLRELNRFNIKKIKTNITGLSQSGKNTIYNSMIKQKFDVDLEIIDSKFITAKSLKINLHHKPKIKDMFTQAYRKLISESEIESLSNGIIIPPIFIDDFIQDYDKIISFSNYWNILNLPQKQSGILFQVMNEVEKMGDSAKIEFEFDKAMDFYHRLYLTSLNCENTNELQANILLKQAEIHYHLDSFDTSTKMLSNSIEIADKFNFPEKSAKAQFYLGMINYVLAKTDKADSFFIMAIENYEKSGNCKSSFDYYQARIRRNMNLSNFDAALEDINEFIERVVSENDKTALAKGFGIKGSIFYLKQLYDKAEECYLEQYKIAKENNDYNELSISLSNQLSLYTYQNNKELQFVNDLIEELKDISKIIKKNNYLSDANFRLGIYFFQNKDYFKAEKYLYNALLGHRKFKHNYQYLSTLIYLGRVYFFQNKFLKALSIFRKLSKVSREYLNTSYEMYAHINIGKIFFERKNFKKSLKHYNLTIEISNKLKNYLFAADSYKHIGLIHSQIAKNQDIVVLDFNNAKKYYRIYKKENGSYDISSEIEFINQKLSSL